MKKEKFHIEYVLEKASRPSLWNQMTTKSGLEKWFAEQVTIDNNTYIFNWVKGEEEKAIVVGYKEEIYIRFKWELDSDPDAYWEFMIRTIELTGTITLEITDFAETEEKKESIVLWDNYLERLKRSLGI